MPIINVMMKENGGLSKRQKEVAAKKELKQSFVEVMSEAKTFIVAINEIFLLMTTQSAARR